MVLLDLRITHANTQGDIFVQFQSALLEELLNLRPVEDLTLLDADHIYNTVKSALKTKETHFVKKVDGKFRRVTVLVRAPKVKMTSALLDEEENPKGSLILHHTDFGSIDLGHLRELLPWSYFVEVMKTIPAQVCHT